MRNVSNLNFHLKKLKEQQTKSKQKEGNNKDRSGNELKGIQNINETNNWFFEKTNKLDNTLPSLTREKGKKA